MPVLDALPAATRGRVLGVEHDVADHWRLPTVIGQAICARADVLPKPRNERVAEPHSSFPQCVVPRFLVDLFVPEMVPDALSPQSLKRIPDVARSPLIDAFEVHQFGPASTARSTRWRAVVLATLLLEAVQASLAVSTRTRHFQGREP